MTRPLSMVMKIGLAWLGLDWIGLNWSGTCPWTDRGIARPLYGRSAFSAEQWGLTQASLPTGRLFPCDVQRKPWTGKILLQRVIILGSSNRKFLNEHAGKDPSYHVSPNLIR